MKRNLILLAFLAAAASSQAAVTFTFDADLQGFEPANFGNGSANTAVSYSTVNGGSMAISNSRTTSNVGGIFGTVAKYFTNSSQSGLKLLAYNELVAAISNGGSISYDVILTSGSVTGTTPTFAQANYFSDNQNGAFDRENVKPGFTPAQLVASTTRITTPIQTTGAQVSNDNLAYFLNSTGALQLGFGSNFDNATNFTYYIDNLTIAAVPEPSSMALLGLGSLLLLRRKR